MSSPFSRSPKCYAVWVPGRVWECGWIPVYFVTPPPPDWKDTSDQGTLWNLVGQIFLWIFPLREKSDILFLLTVAEKKEKQPSSWGACGFAIGWWYRISEEPSTMWSESLRALESTLGGFKDFLIFSSENWGRRSPILMMQYFSNGLGNQPTIQDHSFTNCALSFLIYEVILCQFVCHWSLGVSDPIRLVFWDFEKNIISQK